MTTPRPRISLSLRRYPAQVASHSHAGWHQLVAARSGVLEMDIEQHGGNVDGGMLALVTVGARHAFRPLGGGSFLVIDVPEDDCPDGVATLLERARRSPYRRLGPEHAALCEFLAARADAGDSQSTLVAAGATLLLRALATPDTTPRLSPALASALGFFKDHLADPVTAADAARAAGVSVRQLHVLFREQLGETPRAWLTTLRLQRARQLLAAPGARHGDLERLAAAVGFADSSTLARAFRARFGVTPARFRRSQATGG